MLTDFFIGNNENNFIRQVHIISDTCIYKSNMILFISPKSMFYIIFFILCISCGPRSYLCACTLLCNLPPMKKIWGDSGKCRTMRVITATLRNGQIAVASGGLNWAGKKGGESFLWFSWWFPHRPAWTRIMLLAWYQTQYQMSVYEDRYTTLLLRPETGTVYSKKKE